MKKLIPIEMTSESFKEYGHIISNKQGVPMADNQEFSYWSKVSELSMSNAVSTGVLYGNKREPVIKSFERHNNTPEVLVALEGDSVMCFAKPSLINDNTIDGIQAFYIKERVAFAMYPGTWHWIPIPLSDIPSKFLVLFASGTEAEDLEIKDLDEQVMIFI
jgi:ureidoglycolate hydrolase